MSVAPSRTGAPADRVRRFGRQHPLAPIWLGVLLYSTGPVFVRASSVSGAVFSFWRLWFGVGVFGLAVLVARRRSARATTGSWGWAVAAGVAFGSHQLLMFIALKATSVADVTLVSAVSPIVTGVLAIPVFGERPGATFRAWSALAMVGAAVVVFAGSSGPEGDPVGMALALANVVAFAGFFLLSKASRDHLGVLAFLLGTMATAAVFVSLYVALTGEAVGSAGGRDLAFAFVVAALPGFVGHVVMTWPLRWVPANVPPVLRLAIPVLSSLWAWWFLDEAVGWLAAAGGALVLGGVAGAVSSRAGRRFVAGAAD